MTISSQKIYGPKGAGALFIKGQGLVNKQQVHKKNNSSNANASIIHNSKFLIPIMTGGGQEYDLRSGTENVPAIVGFGKAV